MRVDLSARQGLRSAVVTGVEDRLGWLLERMQRSPGAVVASLAAWHVLVLWYLAGPVDAPTIYPDEYAYIAVARDLGGGFAPAHFVDVVYQFGYGAVLAPVAALFSSTADFHAAAQWVNFVLAALAVPLLWHLARGVFGARILDATLATLVATAAPALLVQPALLWAETALVTLTAAWLVALHGVAARPTWWRSLSAAAVAAATYAVHPRGLVIVMVTTGLFLLLGVRRRLPAPTAIAGLVGIVGAFVVVRRLQAAVVARVFEGGALPMAAESEVDLITSSALPNADRWLRGLVGAIWYQGLVTSGLVLLVGLWALRALVERWRRPDGEWILATALGGAWVAGLLTGALVFLGAERRIDHAVYGRYTGHLTPIILLVGVLLVLRRRPGTASALGLGAGCVALGAVLTRLAHPSGLWTQPFAEVNAAAFGVYGAVGGALEPLRVGLLATAVSAGFAAAARRWPRGCVVIPLVVLWAAAGWALRWEVEPRADWNERHFRAINDLPHDDREGPVVIGDDVDVFLVRYGLQYWYPLTSFVTEAEAGDDALLYVTDDERQRPTEDARLVDGYLDFGVRVWARPGPRHEVLEWSESLFWPDIDVDPELPSETIYASLVTVEDEVLEIDAGAERSVPVWIRHLGLRYPWPTNAAISGDAVVRLGARWYAIGPDDDLSTPRPDDVDPVGENRAEIGDSPRPGSVLYVPMPLAPVDHALEPLPPGRYRVEVDMVQDLYFWFGDLGRSEPLVFLVEVR